MLQNKLSKNIKAFISLLSLLTERDRIILIERFSRDKSMEEVAKQFDVTVSRIQQIENSLINKIEEKFNYTNL